MSPGALSPLANVKALTFDVFGTTVDWRSSVVDELVLRAHRKQSADLPADVRANLDRLTDDDWGRFAQAWRDSYIRFTRSFNPGRDQWKDVDDHHRDSLAELLESWGLKGVYSDLEIKSLSLVWHRLNPWPDSAEGLSALKASGKLTLATLSNGTEELLRDLDEFGSLGFHELFCAETFKAYKPRPETYLGAAGKLDLEPGQIAMVAAHLGDLKGARSHGFRTIYVERLREEAWEKHSAEYQEARDWVDLWISEDDDGFRSMSRQLLRVLQ